MKTNIKEFIAKFFRLSIIFKLIYSMIGIFLMSIVLAGIIFVGGTIMAGVEGYFLPYPAIDTIFAPGYSDENFLRVKPGMTKDQVVQLLGQPLNAVNEPMWFYSQDGAFPFWDFAWLSRIIYFDDQGRVIKRTDYILYD